VYGPEGDYVGNEDAYEKAYAQFRAEVLADAYAGINAFGAGATRFAEDVRRITGEMGMGIGRQENGVRQTDGPPSESYSHEDGHFSYEGRSMTEDPDIYSYDFLVAQAPMPVVTLPEVASVRNEEGKVDSSKVVSAGMKNAVSVGTEEAGKVYVTNRYTRRKLRIDVSSIRHGLNGAINRVLTNARLGAVIGEIVRDAIPINALHNTAEGVTGTYAMAGYAADSKGREFAVIITVEQRGDTVMGIDTYDVTHAVSGRQKRSSRQTPTANKEGDQAGTKPQGVYPIKISSPISIANLLEIVKSTYQSILSDDVLKAFGEIKNTDGHYYGRAMYSVDDSAQSIDGFTYDAQTDSRGDALTLEQQTFFADSKVRDRSGRLLVLYHQTDNNFTVFDTRHPGAGRSDTDTPFGIFMKKSSRDIGLSGKVQMELYANITNPLRVNDRGELIMMLRRISPEYEAISMEIQSVDFEYSNKLDQASTSTGMYVRRWKRENPDLDSRELYSDARYLELSDAEDAITDEWHEISEQLSAQAKEIVTDALRKAGYDGIFLENDVGGWGRKTDAIIALNPEQVKSITNKNPTKNPDVRYSVDDSVPEAGEGFLRTDEAEDEAQLRGYPVLNNRQVVPFKTWVRASDRGNYGLVVGMGADQKLIVAFHNKTEDSRGTAAIPYDMLTAVDGQYQIQGDELTALLQSEPVNPNSIALSEQERKEINELFVRAGGFQKSETGGQAEELTVYSRNGSYSQAEVKATIDAMATS